MWYVETPNGGLEQVANRATAQYLAKQYSTRYLDKYTDRFYTVGGSK
jgi:hypothetical protein